MAFFEWSDELSVKVERMDLQHKKLVEYINEIAEFKDKYDLDPDMSIVPVGEVLEKLRNYTLVHFRDEEELLTKNDYPELKKHQAIHKMLVAELDQLQFEFDQVGGEVLSKLISFLSTWLKGHINGTDKQYSDFIKSE